MSHKLKVNLDGPEGGWFNVQLQSADQAFTFNAEHVPYDSVTELVRALGAIADGLPDALVRWTDGPIEYELVFKQKDGKVNLQVFCTFESGLAGRKREETFTIEGSLYEIAHPLWKALRDIETAQSSEEYNKAWRREFPTSEMERLTRRMNAISAEK